MVPGPHFGHPGPGADLFPDVPACVHSENPKI
ncbi:hypothetical protein Celaphus_00000588 [Cervus elaphus hippelaphus]|uniref:Uncharacterized protein n=1 Tax=Cervus elaphus hippelaphus TaxID=46360 RepID=A0A212D797_CEREH|nr:hypothetical protein Celaphus_00000588 [Cervus elaphus hippelaphus]